jgi:hypothetical protein
MTVMNTNEEALNAFDNWFEALDQNDTFAPVKESGFKLVVEKAIQIASESEYVSDDDSDDEATCRKKKDFCRNVKRYGSGPLEKMLNSKVATSVGTGSKLNLETLQFSKTRPSPVKTQDEKYQRESRRKIVSSSLDNFLDETAPSTPDSTASDTKSCTDNSKISKLSKTSRTSRSLPIRPPTPTSRPAMMMRPPRSKSCPRSHLSRKSGIHGWRKSASSGALPPMSPRKVMVISSRRPSADDIKTKDSLSRSEHGSRRRASSSSVDDIKAKDNLSRSEHGSRRRASMEDIGSRSTKDSLSISEHGSRRRASAEGIHIGSRSAKDGLSGSEHRSQHRASPSVDDIKTKKSPSRSRRRASVEDIGTRSAKYSLSRRRASDSEIESQSTKDSLSTIGSGASGSRLRKDDLAQSEHGMGVSRRRKDDLSKSEHGMGVFRRRKDVLSRSAHGFVASSPRRTRNSLSRSEHGGIASSPRRTRDSLSSSRHGSVKHPTTCKDEESADKKEISSESADKKESSSESADKKESSSESEHGKGSSHQPARHHSSQEDPDIKKCSSDGDGLSRDTATSSRTGDEEQSGQSSTGRQSTSSGEPLELTRRRRRESSHDDTTSHRNRSSGAQSTKSSSGSTCSAGLRTRSSKKEGRPRSSNKQGRTRSSSKEGRRNSSLGSTLRKLTGLSSSGKDRTSRSVVSRQAKKGGKNALARGEDVQNPHQDGEPGMNKCSQNICGETRRSALTQASLSKCQPE